MERFNICSRIIATCLSPHPISRDLSHTGHLLIIIHWPELRYLRPPLGMISLINHDSPLSHQPLAPVVCHARAWSQTTAKSVGSSVEVKRRSHKALIGNFDLESSFWHPYLTTTINIYTWTFKSSIIFVRLDYCTFGPFWPFPAKTERSKTKLNRLFHTMSLYHWTWAKNVIPCHIIASHR